MNITTKSLYISYNALSEPVVQSQVIPYLKGLSRKGIKFYLLTFEKNRMTAKDKENARIAFKKKFSADLAPEWFSLYYHKNPSLPATFFDITVGFFYCIYLAVRNKIGIIHSRAIVSALIGYPVAKIMRKKFIFDTRGIDSEEYVDAGLWKRGSLLHSLAGFLEDILIKASDYVIVLTEKFYGILKEKYNGKNIKFAVIPCAVDTYKFKIIDSKDSLPAEKFGLENKFIITYAGSLGTWYMLKEMVDFFKIALTFIKNAHFLILTQTDKKYVAELVMSKGLVKECFTIITVPHDSVPFYLSMSDAGIFFIKPVFSKLSSSPVKFGEYLSSGLPVVINSKIGDTDNITLANRVGVVVDDFRESAYKKSVYELIELLKDPGLKNRCRETAEKNLSLSAAVDKYYEIYKELEKEK